MYVIETSDGEVHATSDPQVAAAILDRYGPEVIAYHTVDDDEDKALTVAVVRQYAQPNPRPHVGSIYP